MADFAEPLSIERLSNYCLRTIEGRTPLAGSFSPAVRRELSFWEVLKGRGSSRAHKLRKSMAGLTLEGSAGPQRAFFRALAALLNRDIPVSITRDGLY
jgi:hypothetical protein